MCIYNSSILCGLDFHIITIVLDAKILGGVVGVHPKTKACRSISCLEQIFYRAQVLILLWAALVEHQPHFIPILFCTLRVCISLIKCYFFYIYLLMVILCLSRFGPEIPSLKSGPVQCSALDGLMENKAKEARHATA